ncbi:hypothetical protein CYMTET_10238 [Cymbomonas tetramitiformis]|uniref:SGNH hydrolase-type esterase domain-containing protein n=1 Tax=Cymbomonas tetramitiformis TaxID=36881 RepID=A0AAE0GR42_9CHLO|nr:hypothetical protein CYMTET_10238 [Cymbomonas tetramitiformis]
MEARRLRFVLFGDSLTQKSFDECGWGAALQSTYQRKADVCLRGYSGYNTRWALQLLAHTFPEEVVPADLTTVFFGANDANIPGLAGDHSRQHVPLGEYKDNLRVILKRVKQNEASDLPAGANNLKAVLLITPPPVDVDAWQKHCASFKDGSPDNPPNRTFEYTKQYADAAIEVGKETGTPVLDLYAHFTKLPEWKTLLCDGLHFTPEGQKEVFKAVIRAMNSEFPHLQQERVDMDFPDHKAIDEKDPASSFLPPSP